MQSLGTPGAMELASMLTKNTTLRELHCEMNEIHLQGFTAMVNAIEKNKTLIYLPSMDRDRAEHVKRLKDKLFQPIESLDKASGKDSKSKSSQKQGLGLRRLSKPEKRKVTFTEEPLGSAGAEQGLVLLEEKWESEKQRMQRFIARNLQMYHQRDLPRRYGASLSNFL